MIKKTAQITALLILCMIALAQPSFGQSTKVAKINATDEILIPNENITKYVNKFLISEKINIAAMKIGQYQENYYLLATGFEDNWTYIISLKKKGDNLHINKSNTLNACESEDLNINNYVFKKGGIIHCKNCNHKIMGR